LHEALHRTSGDCPCGLQNDRRGTASDMKMGVRVNDTACITGRGTFRWNDGLKITLSGDIKRSFLSAAAEAALHFILSPIGRLVKDAATFPANSLLTSIYRLSRMRFNGIESFR